MLHSGEEVGWMQARYKCNGVQDILMVYKTYYACLVKHNVGPDCWPNLPTHSMIRPHLSNLHVHNSLHKMDDVMWYSTLWVVHEQSLWLAYNPYPFYLQVMDKWDSFPRAVSIWHRPCHPYIHSPTHLLYHKRSNPPVATHLFQSHWVMLTHAYIPTHISYSVFV